MSLLVERAAVLYLPLLALLLLTVRRRPDRRWAGALLLSFAWNAVFIIGLSWVASGAGWWSFGVSEPLWLGVPLDLLIGWAVLWGPVAALLLPSRPFVTALAMLWFDLLFMPVIDEVLVLGDRWLVGEMAGVAVCVIPALLLVKWTREQEWLGVRVLAQFVLFGALNLLAVVTVLESTDGLWPARLTQAGEFRLSVLVQVLVVPGVMAVAAVSEFFSAGRGTPYPYDPPKRLVTTGPYAYVANPMQLSMSLGFILLAVFFGNVHLLAAAGIAVAYSVGLAAWHERGELDERFGFAWAEYRERVRDWIPHWRPIAQRETAELYVASTCPLCSPVGAWIGRRSPVGLRILPAEGLAVPVSRALYRPAGPDPISDGYSGAAAVARSLEHLNLGWALLGWTMLFPGIRQLIQLVLDAVGAGPRKLAVPAPDAAAAGE